MVRQSHRRRRWFGFDRRVWITLAVVLAIGISAAVVADPLVDAVSSLRARHAARVVACGPPGRALSLGQRRVEVALDDGRTVALTRYVDGRPVCGGALVVEERRTPWQTIRYVGRP